MSKPFYNDQANIAEEFHMHEDYTNQTARLALFKINSYKLSLLNTAFSMSRDELSGIIKGTLLNYTDPAELLADLRFFKSEIEN